MIILIVIAYAIIGTILGTMYHVHRETSDRSYDFEDDGFVTVAFGIFWPISVIMLLTYHSFKSIYKKNENN